MERRSMDFKIFGIYDLKEECKKWVERELGEKYVDEFVEKYENINRGIPIGGYFETVLFLDMVENVRAECEAKNIFNKIKKFFGGGK